MMNTSPLLQILDMARWAPSGDNTQPWRFRLSAADHVVLHVSDSRHHDVFDLDGHSTHASTGALIETAAIAATAHELDLTCHHVSESPEERPRFVLHFAKTGSQPPSPLMDSIPKRTVQRGPMAMAPLTPHQRNALEAAPGPGHRLHWVESPSGRTAFARMLSRACGLRLRMPEAWAKDRDTIEWNAQFSEDRVPDLALGLDKVSTTLLRWRLQSRARTNLLDRHAGVSWLLRWRMAWLPAMRCAAHVAILADRPPTTLEDHLAAGRAAQRFWLTATALGLNHQPEMAPVVLSRYAREGRRFTTVPAVQKAAVALASELDRLLDGQASRLVWLGRIGGGPPAPARSVRLPLEELMLPGDALPAR